MHEAVKQRLLLARLVPGSSDGHQRAGQDLAVVGGSSRRGRPSLDVCIEAAGFVDRAAAAGYTSFAFVTPSTNDLADLTPKPI